MYNTKDTEKVSLKNIPEPKGWKILIAMPKVEEKTTGGILRPDQLKSLEETASILGYVVQGFGFLGLVFLGYVVLSLVSVPCVVQKIRQK